MAQTFLTETAPLLEGLDRACLRLKAGQVAGVLAIGCTPSAISGLVAPALQRFRQAHPGVRIWVQDDIAEQLARAVAEGTLDLAVAGRALRSDNLRQTEIQRDPFGLACAVGHPLADHPSVTLAQIDPAEVISLGPETGTHHLLANCPAIPTALRLGAIEAHSTIAQISMIRAGLGVALLPRNALMLFGDPSLRFVPISDLQLWRALYLLVPTRRRLSGPARQFIAQLDRVQQEAGPACPPAFSLPDPEAPSGPLSDNSSS